MSIFELSMLKNDINKFAVNILHIISQRPDSTGSGIYLQQLVSNASRNGHSNFLVCAVTGDEQPRMAGIDSTHIFPVRFETGQEKGAIVGMSDVMPYRSRVFRDLSPADIDRYLGLFQQTISAALEQCRPHLIHSHHLWLVTSLAAQINQSVPIVTSCHGSDLRQFTQCPHLRNHVLHGCRQLDRVCALTGQQNSEIGRLYGIAPNRIKTVGAGYDDTLFNHHGRSEQEEVPCTILYAGKFSRAKGVIWLLQALQALHQHPYRLHMVGSGQGEEFQQCLVEAEKLGDRVTIHGQLSQQQLAGLLKESDVFILPSLYEGLPLVILEALGCGCRVITTDLPGCREVAEQLGYDRFTLITAPWVIDHDTTRIGSENKFVSDLISAITPFLISAREISEPLTELKYYRWPAVYHRIEKVWRDLA